MRFKLLKWTMCNDEKWIDREVKSLKKEGHIVEKRKLKNKDFKFGIYLKQTKK